PKPNAWRVVIEPAASAGPPLAAAPPPVAPPEPTQPTEPVVPPAPSAPSRPTPHVQVATASERPLVKMTEIGASDPHLAAGSPPNMRIHGEVKALEGHPVYTPEALMAALVQITPEKNRREFDERNDTDFAHAIPGIARFRANLFRDRRGPGAVFR